MSLDSSKLENLTKLSDDRLRARCPACAADGKDRKGEHLIIYSNGRFGCAAHQEDREHRSLIFKLAGINRSRRAGVRSFPIEPKGDARRWLHRAAPARAPQIKTD